MTQYVREIDEASAQVKAVVTLDTNSWGIAVLRDAVWSSSLQPRTRNGPPGNRARSRGLIADPCDAERKQGEQRPRSNPQARSHKRQRGYRRDRRDRPVRRACNLGEHLSRVTPRRTGGRDPRCERGPLRAAWKIANHARLTLITSAANA